jgi:phosphoglycolate phosphatase-like HAD superfamily hydrolase
MPHNYGWLEAGRIFEDYSFLDKLAEEYKRKVLNFISLCQYKTVVFDFDGTLTEFKYDKDKLLPCKDVDLNQYFATNNFYDKCRILDTMKGVLEILYPYSQCDVYILSVSEENVKQHKLNCIKKNLPGIPEENIFQVPNADAKLQVLQDLYDKHKREILFVEDTYKTLLNAEEIFVFVTGFHISSLLP